MDLEIRLALQRKHQLKRLLFSCFTDYTSFNGFTGITRFPGYTGLPEPIDILFPDENLLK